MSQTVSTSARRLVQRLLINMAAAVRRLQLGLMRGHLSEANTHEALHAAWNEITHQRWKSAVSFAELVVTTDPALADGYRLLGFAQLRRGDADHARDTYTRGLQAAPRDTGLWHALGDLEMEMHRPWAAESAYRRLLDIRRDNHEVLRKLAEAVAAQDRLQEAVDLLGAARALAPDDPLVLTTLGHVNNRRGEFEEAIDVLGRAVRLWPEIAVAHYELGVSLAAMKRWEAALEESRAAVRLHPRDERCRKLLRVIQGNMDHQTSVVSEQ